MKTIGGVDYYEVVDGEPEKGQDCYLYQRNNNWVVGKYVCIDNGNFLFRMDDGDYISYPQYRCECTFVHDLYGNRYSAYMSEGKRKFALIDIKGTRVPLDEELFPDPDTIKVDDLIYATSDRYKGWVTGLFVAKYRGGVVVNMRGGLPCCELEYFPKWALKSENDDNHIIFEGKKYPGKLTDGGWYEFNY